MVNHKFGEKMSEGKFKQIVDEFFHRLLKLEPVYATYLGFHEYDGQLPIGGRKHINSLIKLYEEFREELLSIDGDSFSWNYKLDWMLAKQQTKLKLFELKKVRMWEKYSRVPDTIGDGIFLLLIRDYPDAEERYMNIVSRLRSLVQFEKNERENLTKPIRILNEIQAKSCKMLPILFKTALSSAEELKLSSDVVEELEDACGLAVKVIRRHEKWLEKDVIPRSSGSFAIGRERFERILKLRLIELTSDEILALGIKYLDELKAERKRLANLIRPGATVEEILREIKQRHPANFREALECYKRAMKEARQFVIEHEIATVPEDERLMVVETPEYLRHLLPFAAYMSAAYFDPIKTGIYLVTPPSKPEHLTEHSYVKIDNITVHEGYPGHHLHFSCVYHNPSILRILSDAPELIEGWAFYCEEMMKNFGFRDTPEHRFMMINDLIWRAVRIILDIKLHRGEITYEEAVEMLVKETGMSRTSAEAEVNRYIMTPTYPLSYLLGKHLLLEIRDELERKLGEKFDLKKFHDAILYSGKLPLGLLRIHLIHVLSSTN